MLNKKFLTKLLDSSFRKTTLARNAKWVNSKDIKLMAYATYVVDKYNNDRDEAFTELKEANYGYCPLEVLAFAAKDGSIKKAFFEFNSVAHFLKKKERENAVEVVACMLSELAKENKKDLLCFDIDKIDAYLKSLEKEWQKMQEEKAKKEESNIYGHKVLKHNEDYSVLTQFL